MEQGAPEIPARVIEQPLDQVKSSGFLKRWKTKIFGENDSDLTEISTNKKPKKTIAKVALALRAELKNENIDDVQVKDLNKIKKVGRRVLSFAELVVADAEQEPKKDEVVAVKELKQAKTHLRQEIKQLEIQEIDLRSKVKNLEHTIELRTPKERAKKAEKKLTIKESVIDLAATAIFATAGGPILLIPAQERYLEKREFSSSKKTKHRSLRIERLLMRQQRINKLTDDKLVEQRQIIHEQQNELAELKAQIQDRDSEYIHEVSDLTERQAEVTHEFTERMKIELEPQIEKPESSKLKKMLKTEAGSLFEQVIKPQSKVSINGQYEATTTKGEKAKSAKFNFLPKHFNKKIDHIVKKVQIIGKIYQKEIWLAQAFFVVIVTIAIIWLVSQYVYNNL